MAIKIVHDYEIGKGLELANSKIDVKIDPASEGIELSVTDEGLRGVVAPVDLSAIEKALIEQSNETERLWLYVHKMEEELKGKVKALEERDDLHATGLELDNDTNEVVLTLNDGIELRVGLGKFLNIIKPNEIYAEIKDQIISDTKAELKGEEIQDLTGTVKGYLMAQ